MGYGLDFQLSLLSDVLRLHISSASFVPSTLLAYAAYSELSAPHSQHPYATQCSLTQGCLLRVVTPATHAVQRPPHWASPNHEVRFGTAASEAECFLTLHRTAGIPEAHCTPRIPLTR